ncbi:MAG: hypothetical protein QOE55_915 [Acidobacteriaceae bacterium]|nr:hypothetical protein [Acidobacteriaceae bacterium]
MRPTPYLLSAALLALSTLALAQSDPQKSFDQLKSLAGSWEGAMDGKPMQISLRVISMGNALMHEMKVAGRPDDPITMLYVDGDRLLLTHYCDAGNRPRMAATITPDGKTVDFHFLDVANFNSKQGGYMQHAVFTTLDANHHTEDWTFLAQGKPINAHLDLQRTK